MTENKNEKKLTGGNISAVYLAGGTVRREMTEGSERIHALLKHLENKSYPYSPRFLGIDEKGREILTYIEGEAGNYPLKNEMWSNEALIRVAKMQRAYHDAVEDFEFDEKWLSTDGTPEKREIICHNDFAVYNIIFSGGMPVGVIDFDMAAPGPKIWDIAYTLYTCIPLSRFYLLESGEKCRYDSSVHTADRKDRIALYFHAYGVSCPENIINTVILRLEGLCQTIQRKAQEGDPSFLKMVDEGHLDHYKKDIHFIQVHWEEWI
ncbi:aminoglycoside phosphotransferase family protein [Jeotgalibacillus proteolyticus]|uniref:Aminoglycoside phosphotransferase n=1 Tax=Jeotgalibacillus proteolyticus TaxID=2082395 RepID=A0A2S5GF68_9BACL|nr:aminoglycoside phosphotransferase family protein [Jeotgalibacillus proteolyticus]PPA71692.1 aminoglycoside phosphotransferase [Jeotgalibacillus proteolyticus]